MCSCQWSPHPATSNMILSTSSQKLLVWDLAAQVALRHSVDAHARAITDINWHARDPNLMATASMDAGIRGWDLRCLNRPYMRVCAWGEAVTQIKWNRQHDHLFATAHGKEVLVWDNRKGSVPVVDFKAHDAKIYGIDWDREHRHKLVTCSLGMSKDLPLRMSGSLMNRSNGKILDSQRSQNLWRFRYTHLLSTARTSLPGFFRHQHRLPRLASP